MWFGVSLLRICPAAEIKCSLVGTVMQKIMNSVKDKQKNITSPTPVLAAGYLGPGLRPDHDADWQEDLLPLNVDDLVLEIVGQPMRRAGRFIKMVCCGALICLKKIPSDLLKNKKIGIFLSTGLGNVDEILPFITQVFKHDGGFPSPNQFANSVSNAAAFFLSRICAINGVVLTVSQEELSFESALWLAQSYLAAGEIDCALVGGCDVFTPTADDYRQRMDLRPDNSRTLFMGEGSSWFLLGKNDSGKIGDILPVLLDCGDNGLPVLSAGENILWECSKIISSTGGQNKHRILLPGFRLSRFDTSFWTENGWFVEDYLPCCGIHPTAAAFGLVRAVLGPGNGFYVHYNCHASGRRAIVAAVKS